MRKKLLLTLLLSLCLPIYLRAAVNVWYWYDEANTTLHLSGSSMAGYTQTTDAAHGWVVSSSTTSDHNTIQKNATKVVIENTITPTTLSYWFYYFTKAKEFVGLEKINTASVTSFQHLFRSAEKVESLDLHTWNTANVTNFWMTFSHCYSLCTLNVKGWNTNKATNMGCCFDYCRSLESLDISTFTTPNVTSMRNMFDGCSSLKSLDVSKFDTSNVTDIFAMFQGCSSLTSLNVSNFNTAKVTQMNAMFNGCSSLTSLNVSNFNTSKVYNMSYMFGNCSSLTNLNLSKFDMSKVTNLKYFINKCSSLTTITLPASFSTSNCTDLSYFFADCSSLSQSSINAILQKMNTQKVTDMKGMFSGCSGLTSLPNFPTTFVTDKVTNMSYMFSGCSGLTSFVFPSTFKTDLVTDMSYMFQGCSGLISLNLGSEFNTSEVTDMKYMFKGCSSLTTLSLPTNFNTSKVTYMQYMFGGCSSITSISLGNSFNTSNVTNMSSMFVDCSSLTTLTIPTNFNSSKVTNMTYMFKGCSALQSLNLSCLNTSEATNMSYMFSDCSSLKTLDLGSFGTGKVTDMNHMFNNCSSLTSISFPENFASACQTLAYLFYGCSALQSLDLRKFSTENVTTLADIFHNCTNLVSVDLSSFNTSNVTNMYGLFAGCSNLKSIDLSNFSTEKLTSLWNAFYNCISLETIIWDADLSEMSSISPFGNCPNLTGEFGSKGTSSTSQNYYWTSIARACPDQGSSKPGFFTSTKRNMFWKVEGTTLYLIASKEGLLDGDYVAFDGDINNPGGQPWQSSKEIITTVEMSLYGAKPTSTSYWFEGLNKVVSINGLNTLSPKPVVVMTSMFEGCSSLEQIDLTYFKLATNVTNMASLFKDCSKLSTIDFSKLQTSNVKNMSGMFSGCKGLSSFDLSKFVTNNVTDMSYLFDGCTAIEKLDISAFDFRSIQNTSNMFANCSNLKTIYCESDLSSSATLTNSKDMFASCYQLAGEMGTAYVKQYSDKTYARIDGDEGEPAGYFTYLANRPVFWKVENNTLYLKTAQDEASAGDGFEALKINQWVNGYIYGSSYIPWKDQFEDITHVELSLRGCSTKYTQYWFYGLKNVTNIVGLKTLNMRNITSVQYMFSNCNSLSSIDLSMFKTDNVTNMEGLFNNCSSLSSLDLSQLNTENVTNMRMMFSGCSMPLDLSKLNMDKVQNISYMFQNYEANLDLSKLSLGTSTTNMQGMFSGYKGESISIDNWNLSNVSNITSLFSGSTTSSISLSNFDLSSATSISNMFYNCANLTSLTLTNFDTSNITNMGSMFYGCAALESVDLSELNTSNVTSMANMFDGCKALTSIDISGFDMSKVTNTTKMFNSCVALKEIICNTDLSALATLTTSTDMFSGCSKLVGEFGTKYAYANRTKTYARLDGGANSETPGYFTSKERPMFYKLDGTTLYLSAADEAPAGFTAFDGVFSSSSARPWNSNKGSINKVQMSIQGGRPTSTAYWFEGLSQADFEGLELLNTSKTTRMSHMFDGCVKPTALPTQYWNTAEVTDMSSLFKGCSALTSLDLSSFNTAKVMDMSSMFEGCASLASIDQSAFDMSQVMTTANMYNGCGNLTSIVCSADVTVSSALSNSDNMFTGCTKLTGGDGTVFDASKTDNAYARVDDLSASSPGYFSIPEMSMFWRYDSDNTTLYLKAAYNQELAGDDYAKFTVEGNWYWNSIPWYSKGYSSMITKVDMSMKGAKPTNAVYWFYNCSKLTEISGLETLNTESVTTMLSMFSQCSSLTSLNVSSFDTHNVTNMQGMFQGCSKLSSLDVTNFNTANVVSMENMFYNCSSLRTLDLSGFITDNVDDMDYMFRNCTSLKALDITNFKGKYFDTYDNEYCCSSGRLMFSGCTALEVIICDHDWSSVQWEITNSNESTTDYSKNMFGVSEDSNTSPTTNLLKGGKGTTFDSEKRNYVYARPDGGTSSPGYFTTSELKMCWGFEDYKLKLMAVKHPLFVSDNAYVFSGTVSNANAQPWATHKTAILSVDVNMKGLQPTTTAYWFNGLSRATNITGLETLDMSNVTNRTEMFTGSNALKYIDASKSTSKWEGFPGKGDNILGFLPNGTTTQSVAPENGVNYIESDGISLKCANLVVNTDLTYESPYAFVAREVTVSGAGVEKKGDYHLYRLSTVSGENVGTPVTLTTYNTYNGDMDIPQSDNLTFNWSIAETLKSLGLTKRWSTLYRTKDKDSYDISSMEGVKAYTVTDINESTGNITLTEQDCIIAGIPMIISGANNDEVNMLPLIVDSPHTEQGSHDDRFKGAEVATSVSSLTGKVYVMVGNDENDWASFIEARSGSIPAERCYMLLTNASAPSRLRTGGDTTGIGTIDAEGLLNGDWYDLNGRKLQGMPLRKGVYINNGRKVTIK